MALKFLNKKGWHTGSLRNIENVWKAEQKHNAEQNKLEELRKQIQEERERAEFRQLQEQAGLVPRQERLDFLYESGLAVGKASSEVFKSLQTPSATGQAASSSAAAASAAPGSSSSHAAAPGALFEDKPQSANDAWRKLHSDPLLLIRQREQEAISRIKNNPVQMAMIRKSVEAEKQKDTREKKGKRKKKEHKKKHHSCESKYDEHSTKAHSDSDEMSDKDVKSRRNKDHSIAEKHTQYSRSKYDKHDYSASENPSKGKEKEISKSERHNQYNRSKYEKHSHSASVEPDRGEKAGNGREAYSRSEKHAQRDHSKRDKDYSKDPCNSEDASRDKEGRGKKEHATSYNRQSTIGYRVEQSESRAFSNRHDSGHTNRQTAPKLSEQERAARLREMQLNAELHDEQRWKRLKKASEIDAKEVMKDSPSLGGSNFLDAAKKSIYGAEKGGSSTIEESVRRRTYYLQGGSAAEESNPFRR